MVSRIVHTSDAPEAIGPYSQGIVFGNLLFSAGQIPLDPRTGEVVPGGIVAQTERVMLSLTGILSQEGLGWLDVLKTTAFLADMTDYAHFNAVYGRHVGNARPVRSTVQVAGLPRNVLLQVDLVAGHQSRQGPPRPST